MINALLDIVLKLPMNFTGFLISLLLSKPSTFICLFSELVKVHLWIHMSWRIVINFTFYTIRAASLENQQCGFRTGLT